MRTVDFENRWWSVNFCLKNLYFFIFLYLFLLTVSRQMLGKFGVTLSMGLILKQQLELTVACV